MTQTIGKVYAEALFGLSREEACEEQIYKELGQAADLLAAYPELTALLSVPSLTVEERLDVLRKVIGDGEGMMEHFLCLLVEKRRIRYMEDIRTAFNALYHEHFSIAEVFVTTAAPLTDVQRTALSEKLARKLGKKICLREAIDPRILGGMVVQYGDTRMDNSLRTRMRVMAENLK